MAWRQMEFSLWIQRAGHHVSQLYGVKYLYVEMFMDCGKQDQQLKKEKL